MKFYYMTKTKGRAGCSNSVWRVTEDYETKAKLKKAKTSSRTTVKGIYTESELTEKWGTDNANRFMAEARPW